MIIHNAIFYSQIQSQSRQLLAKARNDTIFSFSNVMLNSFSKKSVMLNLFQHLAIQIPNQVRNDTFFTSPE